jgi:hypothetical protein
MREANPTLGIPPDDVTVWRYMDLSKFLSLLYDKALWLTRVDCLGDPLEGSLPAPEFALKEAMKEELEGASGLRREMLQCVYASCWHMSEYESAAMWKLYAQSSDAIAIKSTVGLLMQALPDWVFFSVIKYLDYDRDKFDTDNWNFLDAFLHKRLSFQHEQEFRAFAHSLYEANPDVECARDASGMGVRAPVDVNAVVQAVHVSPTAPDWFMSVVQRAAETGGLKAQVVKSGLIKNALY